MSELLVSEQTNTSTLEQIKEIIKQNMLNYYIYNLLILKVF